MPEHQINYSLIDEWTIGRLKMDHVEQRLMAMGYDEEMKNAYLVAYKKVIISSRQTRGFIITGAGAILGFISCVLTLTNPFPELYNFILFGLTSLAILLICLGLYKVFE